MFVCKFRLRRLVATNYENKKRRRLPASSYLISIVSLFKGLALIITLKKFQSQSILLLIAISAKLIPTQMVNVKLIAVNTVKIFFILFSSFLGVFPLFLYLLYHTFLDLSILFLKFFYFFNKKEEAISRLTLLNARPFVNYSVGFVGVCLCHFGTFFFRRFLASSYEGGFVCTVAYIVKNCSHNKILFSFFSGEFLSLFLLLL